MEKTAVWSAERKCFLWNWMKRIRCRKEWQKYFHQHGVLLCAVTEADTQLACVLAGGTGKRLNFCIFFVHPMKMGGWEKALARRWRKRAVPVARKAFSIIPNYRHLMAFARSGALRSGEQRFAAAVRIILIMLLAVARVKSV